MSIRSEQDMNQLIAEWGFLPFFRCGIPGFSIEEQVEPSLWFSDTQAGPWEWKGPVARKQTSFYGKTFQKKAGFISREWLPDFLNYRRDGYDFDARYEDGLASRKDKQIIDTLQEKASLLTGELKDLCGYGKGGQKGFETVITRLQMQTYVNIADFVYKRDSHGKQYGWGVALYSLPELWLGEDVISEAYRRTPPGIKRTHFSSPEGTVAQSRRERALESGWIV